MDDHLISQIEQQQKNHQGGNLCDLSTDTLASVTKRLASTTLDSTTNTKHLEKKIVDLQGDISVLREELRKEKSKRDEFEHRGQQDKQATQKASLDLQRSLEKYAVIELQLVESRRAQQVADAEIRRVREESERRLRHESDLRNKFERELEQLQTHLRLENEKRKADETDVLALRDTIQQLRVTLSETEKSASDFQKTAVRRELDLAEVQKVKAQLETDLQTLRSERFMAEEQAMSSWNLINKQLAMEREKVMSLSQKLDVSQTDAHHGMIARGDFKAELSQASSDIHEANRGKMALEKAFELERSARQNAEMRLEQETKERQRLMDQVRGDSASNQETTFRLQQNSTAIHEQLVKEKRARLLAEERLADVQSRLAQSQEANKMLPTNHGILTTETTMTRLEQQMRSMEEDYKALTLAKERVDRALLTEHRLRLETVDALKKERDAKENLLRQLPTES